MKLYVKYMVSIRCKMLVKEALKKLGIPFFVVELGVVDIPGGISHEQKETFRAILANAGLELMDDKKAMLIEKIKLVIVEMVHYSDELPKVNFSEYISKKLDYDYTYLANLFSEVQGTTIEQYIISHKIERIKELIVYGEMNMTEIAHSMHYSSVAHLSSQFKKSTGLTPTHFKNLKVKRRKPLEDI